MPPILTQTVYHANFGHENYLWKDCRRGSTIATFQSEDLQPFWLAGDRKGYIDHCIATRKTAAGEVLKASVAGRWFNLATEFSESDGDIWIHHDEDALWWTTSGSAAMTTSLEPAGPGRPLGEKVFVLRKPANPWSNKSKKGTVLHWNGLHARAREFLFLDGTFVVLADDNADYILALIEGDDLRAWHARPEWKAKEDKARKGPVTTFTAEERSARRMADTARATAAGANGQQVLRVVKNKEVRFATQQELEAYIKALLVSQHRRCAITGLTLQLDGEHTDAERLGSLDRIDSDGHYEPGNLQIVCRFVNKWKSDAKDDEFRRLIALVRSNGDPA